LLSLYFTNHTYSTIKMQAKFFKTQEAFKNWLAEHYDTVNELWVGYYKKATKKASITWNESVETAICFGWIDGLRKSIDGERYMIRFCRSLANFVDFCLFENLEIFEKRDDFKNLF